MPSPKVHITLGNPSNATTNIENSDNYLMEKSQYVLSYNRNKGTANWVSWQLNKSWLGDVERQDDFRLDESLPEDWYHARPSNYRNSGYDRGHLIPSADRTANENDNSATFLMTNIIPQSPSHYQVFNEHPAFRLASDGCLRALAMHFTMTHRWLLGIGRGSLKVASDFRSK